MWKNSLTLLGLALTAMLSTPLAARQAYQTTIGALTCRTSASLGLIVGLTSTAELPFFARRWWASRKVFWTHQAIGP
jgi:hypothetical protein